MLLAWLVVAFELFIFIPAIIAFIFYLASTLFFNREKPPFIPSHRRLTKLIARELAPEPGMLMYELGAGDMRISLACYKLEPRARYIGIERHAWPRLLARLRICRAHAAGQVEVRQGDLFATDLKGANRVYCYLFPEPMRRLLPKFERELPPGALVASLDFPIGAKGSEKVVDLTPFNLTLGKKLYLYRF